MFPLFYLCPPKHTEKSSCDSPSWQQGLYFTKCYNPCSRSCLKASQEIGLFTYLYSTIFYCIALSYLAGYRCQRYNKKQPFPVWHLYSRVSISAWLLLGDKEENKWKLPFSSPLSIFLCISQNHLLYTAAVLCLLLSSLSKVTNLFRNSLAHSECSLNSGYQCDFSFYILWSLQLSSVLSLNCTADQDVLLP